MKSAAESHPVGHSRNFYATTLAPVDHRNETPFRGWDAAMLVVLFLELAVVMRLVLAD
jgi:hypothetical protein